MKFALVAVVFILGLSVGFYGNALLQKPKAWDLHFVELMQDIGIMNAVYEQNFDLIEQQADISAHAHLLAIRSLESDKSDALTMPPESKFRILNAIYLEWAERPPFTGYEWGEQSGDWVQEFKSDVQRNIEYLRWARDQCQENPEYDCKEHRGRRAPAT